MRAFSDVRGASYRSSPTNVPYEAGRAGKDQPACATGCGSISSNHSATQPASTDASGDSP